MKHGILTIRLSNRFVNEIESAVECNINRYNVVLYWHVIDLSNVDRGIESSNGFFLLFRGILLQKFELILGNQEIIILIKT